MGRRDCRPDGIDVGAGSRSTTVDDRGGSAARETQARTVGGQTRTIVVVVEAAPLVSPSLPPRPVISSFSLPPYRFPLAPVLLHVSCFTVVDTMHQSPNSFFVLFLFRFALRSFRAWQGGQPTSPFRPFRLAFARSCLCLDPTHPLHRSFTLSCIRLCALHAFASFGSSSSL